MDSRNIIKLVIPGNVPSQKNSKQIAINNRTGKRFVRSSSRVTAWKTYAIHELRGQFAGLQVTGSPIQLFLSFYFDNSRRHDLDNAAAGVMDALVKAGVLADDCVSEVNFLGLLYGGLDKENPRCEIFLLVEDGGFVFKFIKGDDHKFELQGEVLA